MVPKELKIYILHELCVISMVSAIPGSKTGYLIISKNRPISRLKKNIKGDKNMKLTEVELDDTSRPENLHTLHDL